MTFFSGLAHPWWLLAIIPILLLAGFYIWVLRRRRARTFKFSQLDLLASVGGSRTSRWQHAPVALLCVGLLVLTVAMAGPTAEYRVPRNKATVMLVIDVSLSMEAKDVAPSRLAAAQQAAKEFADNLTPGINLGLVAFSGTAQLLAPPTPDRQAVKEAIDHLQLDKKTGTGEGIFSALQAISTLNSVLGGDKNAPSAQIVLESDGKETVPENLDAPRGAYTAARAAKQRNIPVNTISFGTPGGTVHIDDQTVPVPVDDASLRKVAELSGGKAFTATSLGELKSVYNALQNQIGYENRRGDDSHPWVVWGTFLTIIAAVAGVALNRRIP